MHTTDKQKSNSLKNFTIIQQNMYNGTIRTRVLENHGSSAAALQSCYIHTHIYTDIRNCTSLYPRLTGGG